MKRRVVVTGMGVVAPNGIGRGQFAEAIFAGKSGIGPITRFDPAMLKTRIAAEVKNFDPVDFMAVPVMRKTDRFAQLGLAATKMALDEAGLQRDNPSLQKAAVIFGSGLGGSCFHEEMIFTVLETHNLKKVSASSVPRITPNAVTAHIALENNIRGPNQVISTACSSSANAIGEAFQRIRDRGMSMVITGGAEATISIVNMALYDAMMVLGSSLSEDIIKASRPFDVTRNGFVMGEGAACLVLEELNHAKSRGANIIAEIVGFGSNCGAYHMVAPNPTGEDAKEAMEMALNDAGIDKDQVDHIEAHGTSTKLNDLSETQAIKALFGQRAKQIPISGIKSMIGHTIGASAAIQAVAICLSLQTGILPPTINLENPDPECDLDYVPNKAREKKINVAVSNSFGFGSNNGSLVFRKWN